MKTAVTAGLLLALISLPSCSTISKADDVLAWTKDKLDKVDAKIEAVRAEATAKVAKVEAVIGPLDRDGNGTVTVGEARSAVVEATKTPEGRRLLTDPDFWVAIAAAVGGVGAAAAGVRKLYHGPKDDPPAPPPAVVVTGGAA